MLIVAFKLCVVLRQNILENRRCHLVRIHIPHFVQRLRVCHHKAALRAKRVLDWYVVDVGELLVQEKLRQLISVGKTLDRAIHVARVSDISQADHPIFSISLTRHRDVAQLTVVLRSAIWLVIPKVFFHAVFVAVADALAHADGWQDVAL